MQTIIDNILTGQPLALLVLSCLLSLAGWAIKKAIEKAITLIRDIYDARERLNTAEQNIELLRSELTEFMQTIEQAISDKVNTIQITMNSQFDRVSNSIEKIYVLMIKKKDTEH